MSTFDFFVVITMILSIILAVLRGFTREVLTIVGFIGAAAAVMYGLPVVGPMFQGMFKDKTTANIAAGLVLGLGTLIVISVASHQLAKGISKIGLGMVDHTLGAVFGAARAALALCLLYVGLHWAYGDHLPGWVTEAKSTPYIAKGSDKMVALLPANIQADIQPSDDKAKKDPAAKAQKATDKADMKVDEEMQKALGALDNAMPTVDKLTDQGAAPAPPAKPAQPGYTPDVRNEINKLIQDQKTDNNADH